MNMSDLHMNWKRAIEYELESGKQRLLWATSLDELFIHWVQEQSIIEVRKLYTGSSNNIVLYDLCCEAGKMSVLFVNGILKYVSSSMRHFSDVEAIFMIEICKQLPFEDKI